MAAIVHSDGRVEIIRDIVTPGDPRLTDTREPDAHSSTHATAGTDPIQNALDPRAYPLLADVLANRPAASVANAGREFWCSDERIMYRNGGGGTWDEMLRGFQVVKQAADATNNTVNLANTDLLFSFEAGSVYVVDVWAMIRAAAATTGIALAFDTSAAVTIAGFTYQHVLANTGTLSGGDSIADDTKRGISSGVAAAATDTLVSGSGLIVAALSSGTARLRFASEVALSQVTFRANSVLRAMRVS